MAIVDAAQQTRPDNRIEGFDLARALAIFGMIVVHFSLVMSGEEREPAWLRSALDLIDGRAAALFVILAGIGVSLMTRTARGAGSAVFTQSLNASRPEAAAAARRLLVRRGLFLLVAGFLNLIIWKGDILRVYGVSLVVAALLIDSSNRRLLVSTLFFCLGFVVLMGIFDYDRHWNWKELSYGDLWSPEGILRNLFYDGFRSVFPWTGLLLIGMWLGRLDFSNRPFRRRVLLSAATIALASEAVSAGLVTFGDARLADLDHLTVVALFGTKSMPPLPLFLLAAGGTAVAVIVVSLEIAEKFAAAFLVRALIATGQMSFTWYIGHIVIGLGGLEQAGLAGNKPLPLAVAAAAAFYGGVLVISLAVRSRGYRGPLEWLLRKIAG